MLGALISGGIGAATSFLGAAKDRAQSVKFAKNGIQWRAEDAKKAGLHPLATMGANIPSYTPVGDGGAGAVISQAGQAIDQSVSAGSKNSLTTQMGKSSMAVDQANIELLKAQKLQILDNIRKQSVGLKGSTTGLPQPGTTKFNNMEIPYTPGTSNAQEIEDKHGGLVGDLLSTIATIQGIDSTKPNPFFYVQKSKRSKSNAKPHKSIRW